MSKSVAPGDEAPNFDLASTEDVVLMLRDETARMAQVLYFFSDPEDEGARRDLTALAKQRDGFQERGVCILAISPAKLDPLKSLQGELELPFPLLFDDRGLAAAYGFESADEETPPAPMMVLVDRRQMVCWVGSPGAAVEGQLPQLAAALKKLPSPTANYPRSIVNRLVDHRVN